MKTTVDFELSQHFDGREPYTRFFKVDFEFIAMQELIGDIERFMSEAVNEYLKDLDMENDLGTIVEIKGYVVGMRVAYSDILTEDFAKPKPKPLNPESLQNDIRYTDSILASFLGTIPPESNWDGIRSEIEQARKWIYHVLNKHFDVEIPEALKNEAADATLV